MMHGQQNVKTLNVTYKLSHLIFDIYLQPSFSFVNCWHFVKLHFQWHYTRVCGLVVYCFITLCVRTFAYRGMLCHGSW